MLNVGNISAVSKEIRNKRMTKHVSFTNNILWRSKYLYVNMKFMVVLVYKEMYFMGLFHGGVQRRMTTFKFGSENLDKFID